MKFEGKYKEIFKLSEMLEENNIPFDFIIGYGLPKDIEERFSLEHYQLCYPSNVNRWISVIEGFGTYGSEKDRLEIMGGYTPLEKFKHRDEVIGGLTANNVFKRIKDHYEGENLWKE